MNEGCKLFSGRRFLARLFPVSCLEPFVCAGDGAIGDVVEVVRVGRGFEEVGVVDVAGGCGGGGDFVADRVTSIGGVGNLIGGCFCGRVTAQCVGVLFGGVQLLIFLLFLPPVSYTHLTLPTKA